MKPLFFSAPTTMFKRFVLPLFVLVLLVALYFWAAWHWSYSNGERAGWVQKLSNKGWICKTWEGELSMVAMPGASPEKFVFTVHDDAVADKVTKAMGKRVTLHYEQKVGLPGSCFGETRYYVDGVTISDEISLSPGVGVPQAQPPAQPAPPAASK
jgi:hypothetical protein